MSFTRSGLSRRERQIMDAVYMLGRATAAEVQGAMPEPPSYSAVRTHLRILTDKGLLRYAKDGARYVYEPVVEREDAAKSTLQMVVDTFFEGSVANAVMTLVTEQEAQMTPEEWDRLAAMVEKARRR